MSRRRTRRRHVGGSIDQLPSRRWRLRYRLEDGTRRTQTFDSHREASDALAAFRTDLSRGRYQDPRLGAFPLSDFLTGWIDTRHDLAPTTVQLYRRLQARWIDRPLEFAPRVGRHRTVHLGRRHLSRLTIADVAEWHAAIVAASTAEATARRERTEEANARRRRHDARAWGRARGYAVATSGRLPAEVLTGWLAAGSPRQADAPRTSGAPSPNHGRTQARQAYVLLSAALTSAVRDGLIPSSPCQVRGATASRPPERTAATLEEVATIAAHMPEHLAAAVVVAAASGLRAGELFALARRHIDLSAGTVRVERTLVVLEGTVTFKSPKTLRSHRTVHLPPSAVDALRAHLARFTARDRDALVFTTRDGRPVSPDVRTGAFARARARAGCEHLTWHSLRHTAGTEFARTGATTRELMSRLGHSTVDASMIYQHATTARDRDLAARLDQLTDPSNNVYPIGHTA